MKRGYPTKDGVSASQHASDRRRAAVVLGRSLKATEHVHHFSPTQLVICQDRAYHALLHKLRHEWLLEHDEDYINAETAKLEAETARVMVEIDLLRRLCYANGFTDAEIAAYAADRRAHNVRPL